MAQSTFGPMGPDKKTIMAWQKFLETEAGLKGLLYLREGAPSIGRSPESHLMNFDAGRVQGFNEFANRIELLRTLSETAAPGSADAPGLT